MSKNNAFHIVSKVRQKTQLKVFDILQDPKDTDEHLSTLKKIEKDK